MKPYYLLLGILISCIALATSKIVVSPAQSKQIQIKPENLTHEYVYLHTDKTLYEPGDIIWFTAFVRSEFDFQPTTISDVLNIELYDQKNNRIQNFKLLVENGTTKGEIVLYENMSGGEYTLKAFTNYQLNDSNALLFEKKIQIQDYNDPQLLLQLDILEKGIIPGMEGHAKFKGTDLTGAPIANEVLKYSVSVDGENYTNTIKTNDLGEAIIKFTIPEKTKNDNAIINVIANSKGATESVSRSIPLNLGNFMIEFYPESGELIAGNKSKVAFSAVDPLGKPVFIHGTIQNKKGQELFDFSSFHDGMGWFELNPKEGESYYARIPVPNKKDTIIELPSVLSKRVCFSVTKNKNDYSLSIYTNEPEEVKLEVKMRDKVFSTQKFALKKGITQHHLNLSNLPMGVAQLTLNNNNGEPVAERLVFVNREKRLNFKIEANNEKYLPRSKVKTKINVTDQNNNPVSGDISIAVTDDKTFHLSNDKQGNILSQLLLEASIENKIEEPNFYLDTKEEKSETALDLLMLTRGWRKIIVAKNVTTLIPSEKAVIKGRIVNLKLNKKNEQVNLEITPTGQKFETDEKGNFEIRNIDLSLSPVLIARHKKREIHYKLTSYNDSLIIDFNKKYDYQYIRTPTRFGSGECGIRGTLYEKETGEPLPFATIVLLDQNGESTRTGCISDLDGKFFIKVPNPGVYQIQIAFIGYETMRISDIWVKANQTTFLNPVLESQNIYLEEVIITSNDSKRKRKKTTAAEIESNPVFIRSSAQQLDNVEIVSYRIPLISSDNINHSVVTRNDITRMPTRSISSIVSTVGGVYKVDNLSDIDLHIRGSRANDVLYYIDGVKSNKAPNLPASSLQSVSVITGGLPANYGDVTGGVVVIETKDYRSNSNYLYYGWNTRSENQNEKIVYLNQGSTTAFRKGREFPKIIHHGDSDYHLKDDRKTLFFSGPVHLDKNGETEIEFYTNDDVTQFRMIVEGIGDNGLIGHEESTIYSQPPLAIESKTPDFLNVNDKMALPVIIRNNTDKEMEITLNYAISSAFTQGDKSENTLSLAANSYKEITLNLTAAKADTTGSFTIYAYEKKHKFQLTKNIFIKSTGFPVKMVYSNAEPTKDFEFTISSSLKNSINGTINIYSDQLSKVIDATQDMIKEPHGCFEQVSSSTYPNLLVLHLLKETNRSNEEIENKALNYIGKGYSQLAAYETPENGFSLWGKSPASLSLTAFGLMEFTQMQKVYEGVDAKMLERTKNFILKKKNKSGYFSISDNSNGNSYTSDFEKAVHCYTVWALTNAGITNEIEKEIQLAKIIAVESNDNYYLALAAMALYNSENKDEAKNLVKQLLNNQRKDGGWEGKHSIMHGSGSINTETSALALLAMMKFEKTYQQEILKGIKFISRAKKPYYGYGSTQATGLVLQALTAYAILFRNIEPTGSFSVTVNNTPLNYNFNESMLNESISKDISSLLISGKNKISFSFNPDQWVPDYSANIEYKTSLPDNHDGSLGLQTTLLKTEISNGETARLQTVISNKQNSICYNPLVSIEIPTGMSVQFWQLNEMKEKKQIEAYEIIENKVYIYLDQLNPMEKKTLMLDFKGEIPGEYTTSANYIYPYYSIENIFWEKGFNIKIR